MGDRERLQQIVWNLLSNAIKFTPLGGQVKVQLDRIGDRISITITDTGIGIQSDALPHIFEYFHQVEVTSPQSRGGLGLGLAIVRQLVELHGGTVCAASQGEEQGSTFSVRFPACNDCPAERDSLPTNTTTEPETPVPSYSRLNNLQVLVVDDETDARTLLTVILEQNGAKVTAVASVKEALQVLEQAQPDVLLSDIGMPDEDGYSLLRQVRSREAQRGGFLPAAAITAFTRDKDRSSSFLAGFQAHLAKPIQFPELIDLVLHLARQAQKIDD